jgi:hypothetical protein
MNIKSVASPLVHTWQGLGFWSGTRHRHLLIMSLSPAKESRFTDFFINLCVLVNFLLPVIPLYFIIQVLLMRNEPGVAGFTAVVISLFFVPLAVVVFSFYRRVLVWPSLARDPRETAELFDDSAYRLLATKGTARWKLFGITLGQTGITGFALYSCGGLRNGALLLAVYLAIWLPAIAAFWLAAKVTKGAFTGYATFSDGDKILMGLRVTTNLTLVTAIIVGFVVGAAFAAIYVAFAVVLAIGAFVIWRAFAAQTDPVNTAGLFDTSEKKAMRQWQDTSGSTHIDAAGRITEAHTGSLIGTVDDTGRVTGVSGDHLGQVGGTGKLH